MWSFSEFSGSNSFLIFRRCWWLQSKSVKKKRNIQHTVKRSQANCTGHILRGNSLLNILFSEREKEGNKGSGKEEEDVRSYWMTLRKDWIF